MFEISRKMADTHNPAYRTIEQTKKRHNRSTKSCMRPNTIAAKKRVTFKFEDDEDVAAPVDIDSESMSESLSSDYTEEQDKNLPQFHKENRQQLRNMK